MYVILSGIKTALDISKLSQNFIRLTAREITYNNLKYHSWYLCQISLQIMLLPIQT